MKELDAESNESSRFDDLEEAREMKKREIRSL
jgi:hypothetical protein